jgi:hypothetical protein
MASSARRLNIMEIRDSTPHSTEIYTEGSKIGGKVKAGAAMYVDQVLKGSANTSYITAVQTIKQNK